MRHSLEPEYRKHVKGYGFLSFARNFGDKYSKKLMNTTIKTGTNFNSKYGKKLTYTATKTGKDFDETNIMEETQEIYIPPEKRKQIIKDLKLF